MRNTNGNGTAGLQAVSPDAGETATSAVEQVGEEAIELALDLLVCGDSPRLQGESAEHCLTLAGTDADLPPILVHRATMRVLDGVHRVQAARIRGDRQIRARYFSGDRELGFVKAVEANISHGLPLSSADRRAAAARIIGSFPAWSDRAIARSTGLSAKTIREIRSGIGGDSTQANVRIGRDGKVRPLWAGEGRRRAAAVLADRPDASLRDLAASAGISLGTARDVRNRVRAGEDPVPAGTRPAGPQGSGSTGPRQQRARSYPLGRIADSDISSRSLLDSLQQDPSLKYSEAGRRVLRWLDAHLVDQRHWPRLAEHIPAHCMYPVADLAARCAKEWQCLADELWRRVHALGQ
jgi:ParB-like chromosome segregation protein Spo0J